MKRILIIIAAALLAIGASAQSADIPSDPSFEMREISCISEGKLLYGQAFFPTTPGKHPAIIYSHGFNGNHKGTYQLFRVLAKEGFICYCFDFAGGQLSVKEGSKIMDVLFIIFSNIISKILSF